MAKKKPLPQPVSEIPNDAADYLDDSRGGTYDGGNKYPAELQQYIDDHKDDPALD